MFRHPGRRRFRRCLSLPKRRATRSLRRRLQRPAEVAPAPAAEAAATAPKAAASAAVKPAAGPLKKTETKPAAADKAPTQKADAPAPEPAALDFNPKALDPKTSARLKIEADQMPAGLDFTVEMNGKLYLRRSAEGNKSGN